VCGTTWLRTISWNSFLGHETLVVVSLGIEGVIVAEGRRHPGLLHLRRVASVNSYDVATWQGMKISPIPQICNRSLLSVCQRYGTDLAEWNKV